MHVQWDERRVRLLEPKTGELLREHLPQRRGKHQTKTEDEPSRTPKSTEQLLSRARISGKSIGALGAEIHRREGELGVRRIQGLIGLAKKHGAIAVDEACSLALAVGAPNYRFVRSYLEHRPAPALSLKQVDPLIRDLTHYRDLIARMTKEPE